MPKLSLPIRSNALCCRKRCHLSTLRAFRWPTTLLGLRSWKEAGFRVGNVLVLGATGAVGTAAIQLARAKGAKVLAAVASPDKADVCFACRANRVIHLAGPDLHEPFQHEVHALTEGNGADVVIEPAGRRFLDAAIRTVAWRGRLVVIGFAAGRIPTLKTNYVLLKNMEVTGLQISDYRKRAPQLVRACFADIFGLYLQGQIKLGQVSRFALADYASALNALLNRSVSGRAVLDT